MQIVGYISEACGFPRNGVVADTTAGRSRPYLRLVPIHLGLFDRIINMGYITESRMAENSRPVEIEWWCGGQAHVHRLVQQP